MSQCHLVKPFSCSNVENNLQKNNMVAAAILITEHPVDIIEKTSEFSILRSCTPAAARRKIFIDLLCKKIML
ncbi:MAG: hypothetical protein ACSLEL_05385 [Candidatus Malihini olakiniferum]